MRSADDADAISKRIAELRQEEIDRLNASCDCPDDVREDGTTIKAHRIGCRHYVATSLPAGFALPPQQQPQRAFWDGNRTVIRQAQSPEAAFLQRLHIRIEAARPCSLRAPK